MTPTYTPDQLTQIGAACAAILRAPGDAAAFRSLRLALGDLSGRAVAAYYYSANTGARRRRSPSRPAVAVVALAEALAPEADYSMPEATWSAMWPRTVSAMRAEAEGHAAFLRACAVVAGAYAPEAVTAP